MGNGHYQVDMAHALTSYFFLGHLNTTTVTYDTLVTDALVFAAMTFVILDRTEDPFTEQATHLGFVTPIVDRLRLDDLTETPSQDDLRRSQGDPDLAKIASDFLNFLLILHRLFYE